MNRKNVLVGLGIACLAIVLGAWIMTWRSLDAAQHDIEQLTAQNESLQSELELAKQSARERSKAAHEAVDKYLNALADDALSQRVNNADPRSRLLEDALRYYKSLAEEKK